MWQPHPADLVAIRKEWEDLLGRETVEADWQRFFTQHPEALALSLPVQLMPWEFHALARPGKREPDFWFFEQGDATRPTYGLVELKTPHDPVVTRYRKGTALSLTREAGGAIEQVVAYQRDVLPSLVTLPRESVVFGNAAQLFVIVGLEEEVARRLALDVHLHRLASIPANVRLLNFDTLMKRFSATIGPRVVVLMPGAPAPPQDFVEFLQVPDYPAEGSGFPFVLAWATKETFAVLQKNELLGPKRELSPDLMFDIAGEDSILWRKGNWNVVACRTSSRVHLVGPPPTRDVKAMVMEAWQSDLDRLIPFTFIDFSSKRRIAVTSVDQLTRPSKFAAAASTLKFSQEIKAEVVRRPPTDQRNRK